MESLEARRTLVLLLLASFMIGIVSEPPEEFYKVVLACETLRAVAF